MESVFPYMRPSSGNIYLNLFFYHEKVAVKAEGEMFGLWGRTNLCSFGQIFDRYICCSTLAESKIEIRSQWWK